MSVARFIADQRTNYRVPHTVVCALLGVSLAWFYKWLARATGPAASSGLHTPRDRRRDTVDRAVAVGFRKARGLHGSPRLHADLLEDGWKVSEKTVAESMRRQGLVARRIKRRNGLTRQDKTKPAFPDLLRRDFSAERPTPSVVPPESWRASLCGFPVGGRGVLVADRAHHPDRAVPSVVVVEPVAPVQHDGLGLAGVVQIVA